MTSPRSLRVGAEDADAARPTVDLDLVAVGYLGGRARNRYHGRDTEHPSCYCSVGAMLPRSTTRPVALSISGSHPGSVSRAIRIRPAQSLGGTSGRSTSFARPRAIPALDGRPVSSVLEPAVADVAALRRRSAAAIGGGAVVRLAARADRSHDRR